jgi:hypothetical protein
MCERTRAVALRLVGLNLHDANVLASRSGCHLRLVQRDGKGIPVTANFHARRISIKTEGDTVVGTSIG